MSGGHFNYENERVAYEMCGQWQDEELNDLFFDLFGGGYDGYKSPFAGYDSKPRECEFGVRGGGLAEALDFWLACDISEEAYREQVERFKQKWLVKRTPKNRVEFYRDRFREYAEDIAKEFERQLTGETKEQQ